MLRRGRAAHVLAKPVAVSHLIFQVDKYKIVQISAPPGTRLGNVAGTIDIDSEVFQSVGAQIAFGRRRVHQQNPFPLKRSRRRDGEGQGKPGCSHADTGSAFEPGVVEAGLRGIA
jgi:hypothetical protein